MTIHDAECVCYSGCIDVYGGRDRPPGYLHVPDKVLHQI